MRRRGTPWRRCPPPSGPRRARTRRWRPGGVDGAHPPGRVWRPPGGRVHHDEVPLGLVERDGQAAEREPAAGLGGGGEVRVLIFNFLTASEITNAGL